MHELTDTIIARFPEIERLKGSRAVVKYGGAAMENDETKDQVCKEIAALVKLGIEIVVVHGGGKEINRWMERVGLTPRFVKGLRATDDEAMLVTEMVLSGLVNSDLVSRLSRLQVRAAGMSGRHGRLLQSIPLRLPNEGDLGRTGEVEQVNLSLISALLNAGMTPVVSPVGETLDGTPLNLNADYAAAALAGALGVGTCVFLTDVDGVKRDGHVLSLLTREQVHAMVEDGSLYGGMIPKVECALRALADGCTRAVITAAHAPHAVTTALLGVAGSGTSLTTTSMA